MKKLKSKFLVAAFALALVLPFVSQAAVYEYVNTAGALRQVEAGSLAEAEILATDRAANSGFIVSSVATVPAQTSTVGDTIASLMAQIAALQSQLAALLAQQEGSAGPVDDGINEDMAKDDVASSTPEQVQAKKAADRSVRSAKKEEVKERSIAIAKAHIYAEEDEIRVSLTDYVEGDEVSIEAAHDGAVIGASSDDADCGGKVAKSDLKLCSREVAFPTPEEGKLEITIEVEGVWKKYSIARGGSSGWLSWEN